MKILLNPRDKDKYPDLPKEIPDNLLDEGWAQKVHGQSLKRINERGGMHPVEIFMNFEKIRLPDGIETTYAVEKILLKLNQNNIT